MEFNYQVRSTHLANKKGIKWVQTHITNFADDFHVCREGDTERALHRAVAEAAELLSLLDGFGFHLDLNKSMVIVKVAGKRAQAFKEFCAS